MEKPQTIFRIQKNKDNPFVMIDKRPLHDTKLSWKAKGIFAYLMSKPDHWEINLEDIVKRSIDGKSSVRAGLAELRSAGHLKKYQERDETGKFIRHLWILYEVPEPPDTDREDKEPPTLTVSIVRKSENGPESDFPQVENPVNGLSTSGESNTSNNDLKELKRIKIKDVKPPWENAQNNSYNPKHIDPESGPYKSWLAIREHLKKEMPLAQYNIWVDPTWLEDYVNGVFIIGVESKQAKDYFSQRLLKTSSNYLKGVSPSDNFGIEIKVLTKPHTKEVTA